MQGAETKEEDGNAPREMLLEVLIVNCLLYKGIDETSWFHKIMDSFKKNIY